MKKLLALLIMGMILISINGCPESKCPQGHCVAPEDNKKTDEGSPEGTEKTDEGAPEATEKSDS